MKNILGMLISGVDGFSANNIFNNLKKNYPIVGISKRRKKNKIIKINLLNSIGSNEFKKISTVIHAAGIHLIDDFKKNPKLSKKKNIKMSLNLIKLCKKYNIKKFIFFSTIDISSEYKNELKLHYIESKIKIENFLRKEFLLKNLDSILILRLPAIIGKNCNSNFLLETFKKLKNNEDIYLWGGKKKYNNFIHLDDIIEIIKNFYESDTIDYKTINCVSKGSYKLVDIILFMKKKLKSKSKIFLEAENANKQVTYFKNLSSFKFSDCLLSLKKFIKENNE